MEATSPTSPPPSGGKNSLLSLSSLGLLEALSEPWGGCWQSWVGPESAALYPCGSFHITIPP